MDLALEARAVNIGALEEEGFLEPEAQARDGGEGDVVVERGGDRQESPHCLHTEDSGEMGGVGARRSASVDQSRWRTCGEKKRRPLEQRRMEAGARPSTFVRCRQERCSSCSAMQSGDVW